MGIGNLMFIKTKVLDKRATLPEPMTASAAGSDLCAIEDTHLQPGERRLIKTGLAMEIPAGYVGLVCSRSGMALKHGVFVLNAPGVVDSDYRGDVGVILFNGGSSAFPIMTGDRIAQLLIMPVAQVGFMDVEELDDTERGEGGFGSTGNK